MRPRALNDNFVGCGLSFSLSFFHITIIPLKSSLGDCAIIPCMNIRHIDHDIIRFFRRISIPLARIALFVIYFWFGIIKVLGLSPATSLVYALHQQTISFIPFHSFFLAFALLECLIGILFLIKGAERIVIPLLLFHMITTMLPLFFLPHMVWTAWFVPTLEGQYIIKNLALIAAGIAIAAHLHPLPEKK
jgi:uncharacterized membrane protein YkgB